jgi:hypothetical protein
VAEERGLDQGRRDRAAVDGDERPGSVRERVQPARRDLLARAGLAAEEHAHALGGDLTHLVELGLEGGNERARGDGAVEAVDVRHRLDPLAEAQKRVPDLDPVGIGEHVARDLRAADEQAVLRAGVHDAPAPEGALEVGVLDRDPRVGEIDAEDVVAEKPGGPRWAPPDDDAVDATKEDARAARARPLGMDHHEQRRAATAAALARRGRAGDRVHFAARDHAPSRRRGRAPPRQFLGRRAAPTPCTWLSWRRGGAIMAAHLAEEPPCDPS